MSFTENAKKIFTETAESVVKASGDILENSKNKYRIYDAKIDLKKLFEKLGQLSDKEYTDDVDLSAEKEELSIQIKELELYIEELTEKVSR